MFKLDGSEVSWLVYADWLEDQDLPAQHIRDYFKNIPVINAPNCLEYWLGEVHKVSELWWNGVGDHHTRELVAAGYHNGRVGSSVPGDHAGTNLGIGYAVGVRR